MPSGEVSQYGREPENWPHGPSCSPMCLQTSSVCTKLKIASQLVQQAVQEGWPFRAVVADSFYGEDRGLRGGLQKLKVPYVMALKPSHAW